MYCLLVARSNSLSVARQRIEYAHKITRAGPRYEWAKTKPHLLFLAISPTRPPHHPFMSGTVEIDKVRSDRAVIRSASKAYE